MHRLRHPLSGTLYEHDPDGTVRVGSDPGPVGWFDARGRWVRGERRTADPELCRWVASWADARAAAEAARAAAPAAATTPTAATAAGRPS